MVGEGPLVGLVVEGQTDVAAARTLLGARGAAADPLRTIVTDGKTSLDGRLRRFNQAARRTPWLVVRDADRDGEDCPVRLRHELLQPAQQSPMLCLRLAVRSLEAWLLADAEAFAAHFAVPVSKVPQRPEDEDSPKIALVNACRSSRRRDVRTGVVPPAGSRRQVGPEYTTFISDYCDEAWRPDQGALNARSLRRALAEVERLVSTRTWS